MKLSLFLSLTQTALGMAAVHCFIPRSALGPGFGKTISAIVFFVLLGPVLWARPLLAPIEDGLLLGVQAVGGGALAAWFAYFVLLNYKREAQQRALVVGATALQATMLVIVSLLLSQYFLPLGATGGDEAMTALLASLLFGMVSGGLLMGSVTMAMLVGHWYLVIPGLPIRWLKGASAAFGVSIGLKGLSIAYSLMVGASNHAFGAEDFFDKFRIEALPLFLLRVLVGLLIPAALAVMAYRTAAMRSTQSSTGILFAAMILVFIGEMIAVSMVTGLRGLLI